MLNLAPQTDENHEEMFCKRARSKMVAQAEENRILTQALWKQIMTKKSDFTWYDPNTGEIFFDGLMIVYIIMTTCNPDTKVGVQVLRDKIISTKSATFKHNIPNMLSHIKSTMDLIEEMGETYDSLLKNTFDALLSAPNTTFHQFFVQEKLHWEAGKSHTFDKLDSIAKTMHNNMCSNGSQESIDPKDARIIALTTEVNDFK